MSGIEFGHRTVHTDGHRESIAGAKLSDIALDLISQ